jgi:hypothetical protein
MTIFLEILFLFLPRKRVKLAGPSIHVEECSQCVEIVMLLCNRYLPSILNLYEALDAYKTCCKSDEQMFLSSGYRNLVPVTLGM